MLCVLLFIFTVPLACEASKLIPENLSHSCVEKESTCSTINMDEDQSQKAADVEMESQTEENTAITDGKEEPMDQQQQDGTIPGDQDAVEMSQGLERETESKATTNNDRDSTSTHTDDDMSQTVPVEDELKKESDHQDDIDDTNVQDESATGAEKTAETVSDNVTQEQEQGLEVSEVTPKNDQLGESQDVESGGGGLPVEKPGTDDGDTQTAAAVPSDGQDEVKSKPSAPEVTVESDSSEDEEEVKVPNFPTTLEEFGYKFNKEGELRSIEGGERFQFVVKKNNKKYNQAHYEAIGEVITDVVYDLLKTRGNLQRVNIPVDSKPNEPNSFFFKSEDALSNPDKLLILIHGSGVVRAGQWARSLIINDCLDSGTQLPYIKRAMEEGYGVMVLNTNLNHVLVDGKKKNIRGNSTPQQHANYVWKHFVKKSKAKRIDIVAHSFGGVVTVDLVSEYYADFKKRVHRIAFTDSVHMLSMASRNVQKWIISHTCNWVSSDTPLDTELESFFEDVRRVSAGTPKHVETSCFSFDSVFKFLSSK